MPAGFLGFVVFLASMPSPDDAGGGFMDGPTTLDRLGGGIVGTDGRAGAGSIGGGGMSMLLDSFRFFSI